MCFYPTIPKTFLFHFCRAGILFTPVLPFPSPALPNKKTRSLLTGYDRSFFPLK